MSRSILPVLVAVVCSSGVTLAPSLRAEVRSGESIEVRAGQTVDGNLYGVAGSINIDGEVLGDVVVSGGTVIIAGHVAGDVLAAGGTLVVTGTVDGDLRVLGGDVSVTTTIPGDALLAGGTVKLAGRVGGDALVAGGDAAVSAPVARTLYLAGATTRLSASVGRDLIAAADRLVLEEGSAIGGSVEFTGNALVRAPGAVVNGTVMHTPAEAQAHLLVRAGVVGWLQGLIGLGIFGTLWLLLFRGFAQRAMDTLRSRPGLSFGVGCGALLGAPMALGMAFAVGVITGGWWISLFGGAVYAMAITITFPLVAALLGRQFLMGPLRAKHEVGPMLIVLVAQALLSLLPVVGAVLNLAIILFGLGAIAVTLVPTMKKARLPTSISPSSGTPVSAPA